MIVDDKRLLFTSDAGITALDKAANEIDKGFYSQKLSFIQIPHHGSKRNVGPKLLNRLLGESVAQGTSRDVLAIASTAKEGEPKHPHKAVLNAFSHRGAKVSATRGIGICHYHNAPQRQGWGSLTPEPYHYEYDE